LPARACQHKEMATSLTVEIAIDDRPAGVGPYEGTLVLPETGEGPGIVLFQEIFGVGEFVLSKAEELANHGYVVLCPDVFWRIEAHVALGHDEAAMAKAMSLMGRYTTSVPVATRVADLVAAERCLRARPEVTGKVAVMGYCLGGMLAYQAAVAGQPEVCVSYYGSGIADLLDDADQITCPILFHFGGKDPYIPAAQVDKISATFAGRDDAEVRVEPEAGHAFENLLSPSFADPQAAGRSWPVTLAFLDKHLT